MFHWSYSCLLQKQQNHQYLGQFLKSINTMQTYGQSCLYLHICLSFLITTTAVSLEKNIPCSKSHLDLIGGGSGSPRGGGTTPEWLHEPTANLHEKPGTKNTQNNLSIGKKTQSMLPQQISSMRTRNMLQCGTSQSSATS